MEFAAQVVISGVPQPLAYSFRADELHVDIGSEVTVELGRREARGWVIRTLSVEQALSELKIEKHIFPRSRPNSSKQQLGFFSEAKKEQRLKEIRSSSPVFLPEQLPLFQWMAEYYGTTLADVIECAVPKRQSGRFPLLCELSNLTREKVHDDTKWWEGLKRRSKVQFRIIERLLRTETPVPLSELVALAPTARAALKKMQTAGLVEIFDENSLSHLFPLGAQAPEKTELIVPLLTPKQEEVVSAIYEMLDRRSFSPALLFGVTGSGKTEVYLRAIEKVLAEGGSALVIVPEVALTPQLFDRFESRLHSPPALLHSQVGPGARWRAWENILLGKTRVAVGARSAVFAPLKDLRLIIVDEEHESSYKQSENLRYHARDVALMRAKFINATTILGSATPSFETLVNAKRGRFTLLQMPERVTPRPLPEIEVVNLKEIKRREMPSPNISPRLAETIEETLARRGQVIILYNRRGFSTYLQCESCNEVLSCPHCSVTLTYHKSRNRLLCHYCNESSATPKFCSKCRDPRTTRLENAQRSAPENDSEEIGLLAPRGSGTEKVVHELEALFPGARIVRLDRDTTSRKDSYRKILGSMRSGEADILVGTQMIAKGHDLPGVTLVGIIDADVGLHTPDFRSSERIYQLITQAAGRAGRGTEPGRVIVQTREPNHPTIVATVTGRFTAFARYELEFRKKLNYPPWGRLLRIIISSPDQQDSFQGAIGTRAALGHLVQALEDDQGSSAEREGGLPRTTYELSILGPAPAPLERLRGRYRWHILVKSNSSRIISHIARQLHSWREVQKEFPALRVLLDVDPYDML